MTEPTRITHWIDGKPFGAVAERTRTRMVSTMPLPFPPEPVRGAAIGLTTWSLGRADRRDGRRNLWLRALDRLGLGFDS